jgi:hypothetical protein
LRLVNLSSGEPMQLNDSLLIIDSLSWDSELGRPAWRHARLDMATTQLPRLRFDMDACPVRTDVHLRDELVNLPKIRSAGEVASA